MSKSKPENVINSYLGQFPSALQFRKDEPDDETLPKEDVDKLERGDDELDFSKLTFSNIDESVM